MADSENTVYEINFDTGKLEDGLEDLAGGLGALETAIGKLDQSISKGFASGVRQLQSVSAGVAENGRQITNAAKTLGSVIAESIGGVAEQMQSILASIEEVISQMGKMNAADYVGMVSGSMDIGEHVGNAIGKKKGKSEGGEKRSVSETMQNIADKLPFDKDALVKSISDVTGKLKEMSLAWAEETKAKILSNAESLKTITMNAVEHVKAFGAMLGRLAASTAAWIANTAAMAGHTLATWAQVAATTAWQAICTAATAVTTAFGAAMSFLASPIGIVIAAVAALIAIIVLLVKNWDTVKATAISVWEAIKEAFGNAWEWFQNTVLDPLANGFKGMVNGIIGFINGMIAGVVNGINAIIGLLNKIKFDIPEWVPGLGGQTFGFSLALLTAPQIPYLAQGAVLPANKPFLAVVGDQRHGTNIEAPLATIQEAVALVMNDQVAAMMAGFEATVEEVRLLRQMVSGIEIGDSTIGQAARRYERKMAVVTGGRY